MIDFAATEFDVIISHKEKKGSNGPFPVVQGLTDTGENVQKWTRVFSARR